MAPELNPPRKPNWKSIAAEFEAKGIHGRDGPLTDRALRRTWFDVMRHKQVVLAGGPLLKQSRRKSELPAKRPQVAEMNEVVPDEDLPEDEFVLQLAGGPKTWPKKEDGDV